MPQSNQLSQLNSASSNQQVIQKDTTSSIHGLGDVADMVSEKASHWYATSEHERKLGELADGVPDQASIDAMDAEAAAAQDELTAATADAARKYLGDTSGMSDMQRQQAEANALIAAGREEKISELSTKLNRIRSAQEQGRLAGVGAEAMMDELTTRYQNSFSAWSSDFAGVRDEFVGKIGLEYSPSRMRNKYGVVEKDPVQKAREEQDAKISETVIALGGNPDDGNWRQLVKNHMSVKARSDMALETMKATDTLYGDEAVNAIMGSYDGDIQGLMMQFGAHKGDLSPEATDALSQAIYNTQLKYYNMFDEASAQGMHESAKRGKSVLADHTSILMKAVKSGNWSHSLKKAAEKGSKKSVGDVATYKEVAGIDVLAEMEKVDSKISGYTKTINDPDASPEAKQRAQVLLDWNKKALSVWSQNLKDNGAAGAALMVAIYNGDIKTANELDPNGDVRKVYATTMDTSQMTPEQAEKVRETTISSLQSEDIVKQLSANVKETVLFANSQPQRAREAIEEQFVPFVTALQTGDAPNLNVEGYSNNSYDLPPHEGPVNVVFNGSHILAYDSATNKLLASSEPHIKIGSVETAGVGVVQLPAEINHVMKAIAATERSLPNSSGKLPVTSIKETTQFLSRVFNEPQFGVAGKQNYDKRDQAETFKFWGDGAPTTDVASTILQDVGIPANQVESISQEERDGIIYTTSHNPDLIRLMKETGFKYGDKMKVNGKTFQLTVRDGVFDAYEVEK